MSYWAEHVASTLLRGEEGIRLRARGSETLACSAVLWNVFERGKRAFSNKRKKCGGGGGGELGGRSGGQRGGGRKHLLCVARVTRPPSHDPGRRTRGGGGAGATEGQDLAGSGLGFLHGGAGQAQPHCTLMNTGRRLAYEHLCLAYKSGWHAKKELRVSSRF